MSYALIRPFLFGLDPETAHHAAFAALDAQARVGAARLWAGRLPKKPRTVMGLQFDNPIGLAAGLDKNAEHLDGLAQLGFGFIEIGTLTPLAQPGNPKPRMFRIPEHDALINRLGFNNAGVEAALPRLLGRKIATPVGVNIGKNAATPIEQASSDYIKCLRAVYETADYIAVNVSSPNTKNLRDLQAPDSIAGLVRALVSERELLHKACGKLRPIAVKIAPDIESAQIAKVVQAICDAGADAIISSNTTLSREGVAEHAHAQEAGGLSGSPLRERADRVLEVVVKAARKVPVIGVGGVMSVVDAQRKLDIGAQLVQVYTGMLYKGPGLIGDLVRGIRV
ncbi:MAG: quinone-dependent dihydroorotate dehydrogenase [Betaproteobacteria bacterium]|nr:MAG: quinone-dependent dihydroorotate dehydrogenase [Betaproteobacteria bacterium]